MSQYHGGTNFGRTAGGPFIATSYDYDAPIDEYGIYIMLICHAQHAICLTIILLEGNVKRFIFCFLLCFSGLLRQPKWGHLRDLHKAIKMCEPALVATDPVVTSIGRAQQVNFSL